MKRIIVSNNPLAQAGEGEELVFVEGSALEVFKLSREYLHLGWKLCNHPLTGSIKPRWIYYKTLFLEEGGEGFFDTLGLVLISDSINLLERTKPEPVKPEIISDLMFIDWELSQTNHNRQT